VCVCDAPQAIIASPVVIGVGRDVLDEGDKGILGILLGVLRVRE
jgi:hypothetical protein